MADSRATVGAFIKIWGTLNISFFDQSGRISWAWDPSSLPVHLTTELRVGQQSFMFHMPGCCVRMFWTLFHDHVRRFLLLLFFILNLNYLRVVIPNYDIWISRGLKTLILQTNLLFTRFLGSYGAYALIKLPFSAQLLILEHFFVMVGHLVVRDNLLNWLQVNAAGFSPSWGLDLTVVFKNLHRRAFL